MTASDQPAQPPGQPPEHHDHGQPPAGAARKVDRKLLEILVCPLTKATLEYRPATAELISRRARLAYPIVDGVPLMTAEAARELTDEDLK